MPYTLLGKCLYLSTMRGKPTLGQVITKSPHPARFRSFFSMDDSASSDYDDIDSLPTTSSVISSSDSGSESDAQREWEASLEQLQLLLTIVLIPFAGKYFGRKFAFWSMCQPLCPAIAS